MRILLKLFLAFLLTAGHAGAQDYPSKPIRMLVPYPPGGTADLFARYIGDGLSSALGQTVVVENRAGANGNIASELVAKSTADGYTLLLGTSGSNAVNPSLYAKMAYNAWKEMMLIAPVAQTANVLVVRAGSQIKSVKELIAIAKQNPGKLTFASSGNGSVLHLSGVMLANRVGVQLVHVPYKGTVPALLDVMTGRVDMMFANGPSVVPDVKSGKLRALAVTTANRASALPEVPTMMEAGIQNFDLASWFGVMGPAGIPQAIAAKLNSETGRILQTPATKQRFQNLGAEPFILGPEKANAFFLAELNKWGELVKASGAKVD